MRSRRRIGSEAARSVAACLAAGVALALLGCSRAPDHPEFGFQAAYEKPCTDPDPDDDCDMDGCGPNSAPWLAGPHSDFAALDLARIARESLAWFQEPSATDEWRENSTARLELVYPSDGLRVRARYDPALGSSWEQQLTAWFDRFPPRGDAHDEPGKEYWGWNLDFGGSGEVRGDALSDTDALAQMQLLALRDPSPHFRQPACSLTFFRRTSRGLDCFGSDAVAPEQIEVLPRRIREKRAQYE